MDIGGWLRSLGLEQYEVAFHANAVDADVLRDLTDQDLKKLGVPLGHRRKLLRAIAALDDALAPASAPRPTPLPIPPEAILAAAAAGTARERQQGKDHSVSPSPQPSPMSSRLRPAEMIGDRFLPSLEGPTLLLTASDDRHDDDIQTAETGEAYGAHDYHDDLPSPRWRDRLVIVIAVIALAGLGAVGAFAYRAVFAGTVLPALPPIIKAENAPNENVPNYGDDRPSDLSQTSIASAGSSEEFVSRWPADIQGPPKTAPISPNPSASPPSARGSWAVAPIAPAPAAPPPLMPLWRLRQHLCRRRYRLRYPHRLPRRRRRSRRSLAAPTGPDKPIPRPRLPNHPRQSRVPQRRLRPEISLCGSLPTPRQGHPKQSRLPQWRFRSVGLCRSLLTHMAIRRRRRRLAPVCLRVREPLRRLPPAEATRLRWPPNAARPMPTRSFEVSRPSSPTSLAGANRSCAAPFSVPRGSITAPRSAPSRQ